MTLKTPFAAAAALLCAVTPVRADKLSLPEITDTDGDLPAALSSTRFFGTAQSRTALWVEGGYRHPIGDDTAIVFRGVMMRSHEGSPVKPAYSGGLSVEYSLSKRAIVSAGVVANIPASTSEAGRMPGKPQAQLLWRLDF